MTEKQEKHFYFPLWNRACRANAWRMQKGRLELAEAAPEPANTVISMARRLADQEHRAVTLTDLRHASHVVACGLNCSHNSLRNRELTRWGWLARLLVDPDDLEAMNHWLHPELDEQESLEAKIERVPGAYVRQICVDRFGVGNWRSLTPEDRRALIIILSNRSERFHRPFSTPKERHEQLV